MRCHCCNCLGTRFNRVLQTFDNYWLCQDCDYVAHPVEMENLGDLLNFEEAPELTAEAPEDALATHVAETPEIAVLPPLNPILEGVCECKTLPA